MVKPLKELIDELPEDRQQKIKEGVQAIEDSDWWQDVCKLIGAKLINFTDRIGATILFDGDNSDSELDGRIAAYIIAQAGERKAFSQRVLKDLKAVLKGFQEL